MIRASTFSPADGFALLHPASKPRLDAARILTLSGTIALNLLLFCLLMLPIRLPPTALTPPISRDPLVRLIPPPPQVVEIVLGFFFAMASLYRFFELSLIVRRTRGRVERLRNSEGG